MEAVEDFIERFEEVSEFSEVVKIYTAVIDNESVRLEVHKNIKGGSTIKYEVDAFTQKDVFVTPAYGTEGQFRTGEPTEMTIWVEREIPWVDGESPEDALRQALAMMRRP